jgi:metal-responsive CopG/Arc/MetJ family transcriptional regulator
MRMAVRVPVNMTLPRDLVERLDAVVGPRQRSAFVEEAITYRLRREEMRRAWGSLAGALDPADYPEWSTAEKVQQWVRDRRTETTSAHGE